MLLVVQRPILYGLLYIALEDDRAIQGDLDPVPHRDDLFLVPLAGGQEKTTFCGNDAVDGAVVLTGIEVFVFWRLIVEDLELHAYVSSVTFQGGTDADAIVGAGCQ